MIGGFSDDSQVEMVNLIYELMYSWRDIISL